MLQQIVTPKLQTVSLTSQQEENSPKPGPKLAWGSLPYSEQTETTSSTQGRDFQSCLGSTFPHGGDSETLPQTSQRFTALENKGPATGQ